MTPRRGPRLVVGALGGVPMRKKRKAVLAIVERGGRYWWRPLGIGFENPDGSIDVKLRAVPPSLVFRIRDIEPRVIAQETGT
jgi:hypothetical protein